MFWNEKTHFQGIKTRSSKSRKVAIFVKGLTHGFGTKMAIFAASFFFGKLGQENVFFDILQLKNAFLGYKNKKLKKSKNCDYSNGVNPWFLYKKWPFFQLPFARQYRPEKRLCFRYSRTKKTPDQTIKTRSSKTRKIAIFPKRLTHGFGPKMTIFPTSFFQAKQAREMSFTIFQNEKTPFQAIKTRSLKSRKIAFFPKRLTHGFSPKMAIFKTSFFQAIQARKMCFTIFQNEKTTFQAIKKEVETLDKLPLF